jgi:hypothetical protein
MGRCSTAIDPSSSSRCLRFLSHSHHNGDLLDRLVFRVVETADLEQVLPLRQVDVEPGRARPRLEPLRSDNSCCSRLRPQPPESPSTSASLRTALVGACLGVALGAAVAPCRSVFSPEMARLSLAQLRSTLPAVPRRSCRPLLPPAVLLYAAFFPIHLTEAPPLMPPVRRAELRSSTVARRPCVAYAWPRPGSVTG